MICFQLSLWDGKIVIEAGTGSGAMTTAMARCVMPRGSVRTFEFNEVRAQKARDEFEMNGLTEPLVVPRYRDVCGEGFGMSKEADAIFLRSYRSRGSRSIMRLRHVNMALDFAPTALASSRCRRNCG